MALQHLRSSTANKRPDPTAMAAGQLALNSEATSPGLFFKNSSGNLVKVGPVHVGTTAPNATPASGGTAGNSAGELWLDTSLTPNELKTWDGSAWVSATGQEIPVSKLADGSARQLLQTDAAGTGVEWTSNVDVPGTLDVTSTATFDSIISASGGTASAPSITFTGDVNTGLYSPGADQVAISTNGSGRLFVNSSGSVGIGTSAPSTLLHVAGSGSETTTSQTPVSIYATTSSTAANGFGPTLEFGAEASDGSNYAQTTIRSLWTDATAATRSSALTFSTRTGAGAVTERLRIDDQGRVGIGSASPFALLHVKADTNKNLIVQNGGADTIEVSNYNTGDGYREVAFGGSVLKFNTGTAGGGSSLERARIDSSGRLLVGTSTAPTGSSSQFSKLAVQGNSSNNNAAFISLGYGQAATSLAADANIATINFTDTAAGQFASIQCTADGSTGANNYPGRIVLSTTAAGASSPTERMRLRSDGTLSFNDGGNLTGGTVPRIIHFAINGSNEWGITAKMKTATDIVVLRVYNNSDTLIGSIVSNSGTGVAFNTSSDYRLKENVTAVTDGITRLQQLNPSRFNFIADPDKTVDGFVAHEVQAVVPEAITGEKDAVDADGNPIYQGIDQSKLVPLLTAALQEAVAKIETLEARLTAAGIA